MPPTDTETKEELHQLIDRIPPSELAIARRILELLAASRELDWPSLRNAPIDDEAETEEERAAAERARQSPPGMDMDQDEFRRDLGL